ncbi:MAG TPA: AAA family ATPase, partial [Symbiobacteriaceae bacterium]|nr:AAA family ATPase [Symbiobacteriaceae bacterium]
RKRLPGRCRTYKCTYAGKEPDGRVRLYGLEAFGEMVLKDLTDAIDKAFPQSPGPADDLAMERRYHDAYLQERALYFEGRAQEVGALERFAASGEPGVFLVTGAPGCGKSALLATFAKARLDTGGSPVLAHFVGASPGSADLRRTLLRLARETARRFGLTEPEAGATEQELRTALAETLQAAAGSGRLLLVVDGVNQLHANDENLLGLLPSPLPEGIQAVISSTQGPWLEALSGRTDVVQTLRLDDLQEDERKALVRKRLALSGKHLDESEGNDQMALLLQKQAAGMPLYLMIACEELRVFGDFARVSTKITQLAGTVEGLLEQVLDRLERDHGEMLVRRSLCLLAAARQGLAESELLGLLRRDGEAQFPRARWTPLLHNLVFGLHRPGEYDTELLSFFHSQMREAILAKYPEAVAGEHRHLAAYFRQQADPGGQGHWGSQYPRALAELPYHMLKAGDGSGAQTLLTDLRFLEAKGRAGLVFSLTDDYQLLRSEGLAAPALGEFAAFIRREGPLLALYPELTVQQAAHEPEGTAPAVAAEALLAAAGKPWWRLLSSPRPEEDRLQVRIPVDLGEIFCLAFSPDGVRLAVGAAKGTRVVEAATGRTWLTLAGAEVKGCAWSGDGSQLYTAAASGDIVIWDAQTGAEVRRLPGDSEHTLTCCAFSPNRTRVAVGATSRKRVRSPILIRDLATGEVVRRLKGHWVMPVGMAWSPDGKRLASVYWHLRMWDVATGRRLWQRSAMSQALDGQGMELRLTWPDDGAELLLAHTGVARCRTDDGRLVLSTRAWGDATAVSPRGTLAVSALDDGRVLAWDVATGQVHQHLGRRPGDFRVVEWAPGGELVAAAGKDGNVSVWAVGPRDAETSAEFVPGAGVVRAKPARAHWENAKRFISSGGDFMA